MKKLLALLAVLGMVNVASATVTLTPVASGTVNVGGTTYQKIVLNFAVSAEETLAPNAWDIKLTGLNGQKNIGLDVLYWDFDYDTNTGDPIDGTYGPKFECYKTATLGSTALGVYSSNVYLGTSKFDYAGLADGTTGTFNTNMWNVAFAYAGGRRTLAPIATVYLLDNTQANVHFEFGYGGNNGAKLATADQVIGVPEPATMGLLAVGALGLIRRKLA